MEAFVRGLHRRMDEVMIAWFGAQLRRWWPSSLRAQLMLILLPVVGLPVVATGYVLKVRGHATLVEEKRIHLEGVTALLERHLQQAGGFDGLLRQYGGPAGDSTAQVTYLNGRLRGYTDEVAQAFPEVGVGYFHRGLDAIVTYGPSPQYGHTVGQTIAQNHPGRGVMENNRMMTVSGDLVRGNIMNAMRPIVENGRVVGYIWANEFLDAIDEQASAMRVAVYSMTLFGFALSLAVVFFVIAQLTGKMAVIKQGLTRLRFDLRESIPPIKGEIGEMVDAINELARALLETRSMHDNILDSLADAVITVDAQHNVTYVNPAGCELFGCKADDAIGRPYITLFRSDAHFSSLLLDTLQTGREHRGIEIDYPLQHSTPHVLASTSLLYDGRGHQLGVVAIIRDVTKTFALQRQVAQNERLAALGGVAAGIAHELRTPLTSIRGFVQYLQGSTDPKEWQEYGTIIIREVDGLNRIVSELLDLARPQPLRLEAVQLNKVVDEVLLLLPEEARRRGVEFICEFDSMLPDIQADKGQLKQVLLNILLNAVQAISGAGQVRVTTQVADGRVAVRVTDNGCGIPEAIRKQIFDPFFSTKPNGTGLGMAIARRIVESHQGSLAVESVEQQGCTVTLTFPRILTSPMSS